MTDDDLRFGDVSGGSSGNSGIFDTLIEIFVSLIMIYVILRVVEILFNVPIPLI